MLLISDGKGIEKQIKVNKRGERVTINGKSVNTKLTMSYLRSRTHS